ncbi:MAG: ABC transporter permease, partial [Spirochaetes bacterium]|nr:ABC transporter permease [Spirochaetota bacterium]
ACRAEKARRAGRGLPAARAAAAAGTGEGSPVKIFLLSIAIALDGILTHKLRSLLTMLGVIFGVAAVVAMLAIGAGAQEKILATISLLGIRNVYVYDKVDVRQNLLKNQGEFSSRGLTLSDVRAFESVLGKDVLDTAPVKEATFSLLYRDLKLNHAVVATTEKYFSALNLAFREGRSFTAAEVASRSPVCVVGGGLAQRLKRHGFTLGDSIKVKDTWVSVVGILESKAVSSKRDDNLNYEDFNDNAYLPLDSEIFTRLEGNMGAVLDRAILACREQEQVGPVASLVDRILTRRHRGQRDYKLVIPEDLLRQHQETQRIFDIVLGAIAGISLLVGGIGIMNIMLASILERTKEIGLLRAVGATRAHIQWQFLLEAVLLSVFGGLLGIGLAFGLTWAVTAIWAMPTKVTALSCFLSFGVAAAVGITFGFFPARKAGQMNPIDALRWE